MNQPRDNKGRFTTPGTPATAPQSPQAAPNVDNAAEQLNKSLFDRARAMFAKLIFGMTKVADHGPAKAATLAQVAASQSPARSTDSTGNARQKATGATGAPGAAGDGGKGVLGSVFAGVMSGFTSKLILILAPLTAFATILNASTSGFKIFLSAINVFAATLGPILLPFFILLSAALLTASGYIWDALLPALKDFYTLIIIGGINAMQNFINWLGKAIEGLSEFADELGDAADDISDDWAFAIATIIDFFTGDNLAANLPPRKNGAGLAEGIRWIPFGGQMPPAADGDGAGRAKGGGGFGVDAGDAKDRGRKDGKNEQGTQKDGKSFIENFKDNIKLSIQEFKFQNQPKASFSGLVQASRNAQLAAVNVSPFEKVMETRMQQVITILDEVAAKLGKPAMVD